MQDKFTNGRPNYDEVAGVIFTPDVAPYEFMKLRLLNSAHSALSYISLLLGHSYVYSAMADSSVANYVRKYMAEIATTLDPVQGVDLEEYQNTLVERFSNPEIADTLLRLALNGSQKFHSTLPLALEKLKTGGAAPRAVCFAFAAYFQWAATADNVDDPLASELVSAAKAGNVGDFLKLFVGSEENAEWLRKGVEKFVADICEEGCRAVVDGV